MPGNDTIILVADKKLLQQHIKQVMVVVSYQGMDLPFWCCLIGGELLAIYTKFDEKLILLKILPDMAAKSCQPSWGETIEVTDSEL